jgi:SAM-dependent methyltransferase
MKLAFEKKGREAMTSLNVGAASTRFSDVNIDIRREAFSECPGKGLFVIADIAYLPFKAGSFNFIYASNVLEHLKIHPYDALNELGYVCNHGGVIQVVSPPSNFKCCIIEAVVAPFIIAGKIKRKHFRRAWDVVVHFFKFPIRMKGQEKAHNTGFGGHRWLLPWGWKLYYREWFPWRLRGWNGLHVLYEAFYIKNAVSADGEEYELKLLKETEIMPYPDKHVTYNWY